MSEKDLEFFRAAVKEIDKAHGPNGNHLTNELLANTLHDLHRAANAAETAAAATLALVSSLVAAAGLDDDGVERAPGFDDTGPFGFGPKLDDECLAEVNRREGGPTFDPENDRRPLNNPTADPRNADDDDPVLQERESSVDRPIPDQPKQPADRPV